MNETFKKVETNQLVMELTKSKAYAPTDSQIMCEENMNGNTVQENRNLIHYMDFESLIAFIADMFFNRVADYLKRGDKHHKNYYSGPIKALEEALWCLDEYETFAQDLDIVFKTIKDTYNFEVSDENRMLLHVMNYNGRRHHIDYYAGKAKEYTLIYHTEIELEKALKKKVAELAKINENVEQAVFNGYDYQDYDPKDVKPNNPYHEQILKDAWEAGWELGKIYELWRNVLV